MSSFNDIKKVTYSDNRDSIVALKEYILVKDETSKKQYIIFKFQNNLNQELSKMTFDVMQYDSDNFMIKKSTIKYEDFIVDRGEVFVPKLKMEADIFCNTIQIELTYAKFERVEYVNKVLKPIPFTHKDFVESKEKPIKPSKKEQQLLEKKRIKELKKNSKESDKRKMEVLDVTNRNKPRVSAVLTIILSLCLVIFVATTVVLNAINGKLYNSGDYMYEKIDSNTAKIHKYYGKEENIIIPEKIDNYNIVEIDKKAFKDSNCYSISFSQPITINANAFENCSELSAIEGIDNIISIGPEAFRNCSKLTSITTKELDFVGVRAFENCTSLTSLSIPNALIDTEAFKGCSSLTKLDIRDTNTASMCDVFGDDSISLVTLSISRGTINTGYFKKMSALTHLELKGDPTIDFGALEGTNISGHFINETVETLNGKIIAYKVDADGMITLPDTLTDLDSVYKYFQEKNTDNIKIIQTAMKTAIDEDFLYIFEGLTGFGVLGNAAVDKNAIADNNNIKNIYWDSNYNIFETLYLPESVNSIYFGNHENGNYYVNRQFINMDTYENINNLYIRNVKGITQNSLEDLIHLTYIEVKNIENLNFYNYQLTNNIEFIVINKNEKLTKLDCQIMDLDNLQNIFLPDNITTLNCSIKNCMGLNRITIPQNVEEIGDNFLLNCNVREIIFNDKLKKIGNNFIYNCPITNIALPNSITTIGSRAFRSCTNLIYLTLPNKLTTIGSMLISDGTNLDQLIIPDTVTGISLPLIGNNSAVSYIETPFVGSSKDNQSSFKDFSRTLNQTYYLTIKGNLKLTSNFSYGLDNLYELIVKGEISGATKNVFSNMTYLKAIRFSGELSCTFSELFVGGIELDRVYLNTKSKITGSFFDGMTITSLAIYQYETILNDSFDNSYINNLFISNNGDTTVFTKEAFYINVGYHVGSLFFETIPARGKEYSFVKQMTYRDFNANFLGF